MQNSIDNIDSMSVEEFLQFAKRFRIMRVHNGKRDTSLRKLVEVANKHGYTFEIGCCGTNYLHKIDIQK